MRKTKLKQAIESCKELILFLDRIEQTSNFDPPRQFAFKKDQENALRLLELVETVHSKDQIREAWSVVNEMRHYFGGYVSGAVGKQQDELFDQLWHEILDLLQD